MEFNAAVMLQFEDLAYIFFWTKYVNSFVTNLKMFNKVLLINVFLFFIFLLLKTKSNRVQERVKHALSHKLQTSLFTESTHWANSVIESQCPFVYMYVGKHPPPEVVETSVQNMSSYCSHLMTQLFFFFLFNDFYRFFLLAKKNGLKKHDEGVAGGGSVAVAEIL